MYSREPVRNHVFISATIHGLSFCNTATLWCRTFVLSETFDEWWMSEDGYLLELNSIEAIFLRMDTQD